MKNKEAYAEMNLEQLSDINPDILILANNEGKLVTDEWKTNPLWKNLKAVKNDKVFVVDRDLWTRFRGVISAEAIGKDTVKLLNNSGSNITESDKEARIVILFLLLFV